MDIALETIDVWKIEGEYTGADLFGSFSSLFDSEDVLVVGSYCPSDHIMEWLLEHSMPPRADRPYGETFDINRREYPRGRCYELQMLPAVLQRLHDFAGEEAGSLDKQLFFDHLVIFRDSFPILPLLSFHDAFYGEALYLSGHFAEKDIQFFCERIKGHSERVWNPTINFLRPPPKIK